MKNEWVEIPHLKAEDMRAGYYWFYLKRGCGHGYIILYAFEENGRVVFKCDDKDYRTLYSFEENGRVAFKYDDEGYRTLREMERMGYYAIQRCEEPPFVLPKIIIRDGVYVPEFPPPVPASRAEKLR